MSTLPRLAVACSLQILAGACTYQSTPVPVTGDTRMLEGKWEGTYSSEETGRTGSIVFELKAGTDSAWGDVLMLPAETRYSAPARPPDNLEPFRRAGRLLVISFVRCEDGEVTGRLEPYQDPDTGERLYTTFEGKLKGKTFSGTFVTFAPGSGHRVGGKWSVRRSSTGS
jgi:hypothetical protein